MGSDVRSSFATNLGACTSRLREDLHQEKYWSVGKTLETYSLRREARLLDGGHMASGREAPEISDKTAIELWIKAGARCSFPGCNEYLLTDTNVTNQAVKHGNIAHIIAASKGGARGINPRPMETRSEIDNL